MKCLNSDALSFKILNKLVYQLMHALRCNASMMDSFVGLFRVLRVAEILIPIRLSSKIRSIGQNRPRLVHCVFRTRKLSTA